MADVWWFELALRCLMLVCPVVEFDVCVRRDVRRAVGNSLVGVPDQPSLVPAILGFIASVADGRGAHNELDIGGDVIGLAVCAVGGFLLEVRRRQSWGIYPWGN